MRPFLAPLLLIYATVANADHIWWHFPPGPANHILAPGDIDGDGVVDLIRVAHTGKMYVTDVNGLNRYTFQSLFIEEVQDVAALPDTNGNGSPDLAVKGRSTSLFNNPLEIWDPMTSSRLSSGGGLPYGRYITWIWDQNGDGVGDLAELEKRQSNIRVASYDSTTMARLHAGSSGTAVTTFDVYLEPVQLLAGPKGIGMLGEHPQAERADRLEFRNPDTNTLTQRIWLGKFGKVHEARPLPDINGNGSREWAVLRTTGEGQDQRTSVVIRDGETKAPIRTVGYIGWADPLKLAVVNGTELAVVSRFDSGAQPLEVRDARTGALRQRVWFPATLHIQSVTRTPDINNNGSNEIAVIGEQWNKVVVMITDSRTGTRLRRIVF